MGNIVWSRKRIREDNFAMLTILAPAKLNLTLEVLGKRTDGYHEIRSLAQTISLCDILSFEPATGTSLECNEASLQNDDNLVLHAAELLKETYGYRGGSRIKLEKNIPWSAGLGGGSSDAAATLLALNLLWQLQLKTTNLLELAAQLGSDVPFFIYKGTALLEGRGEKITPLLPTSAKNWFVLLVPPLSKMLDKTKKAYSLLKESHFTTGQSTTKAAEQWIRRRQISPPLLCNVFDSVAFNIFPELNVYWKYFEQAGATHIHLAGSGPTLFAPFDGESHAREVHQYLAGQGIASHIVSTMIESAN